MYATSQNKALDSHEKDNSKKHVTSDEGVIGKLQQISAQEGPKNLSEQLALLNAFLAEDMAQYEAAIEQTERGKSVVERGAHRLLLLGGKRLRPMCVALASRLGEGFTQNSLDLGVAVELIHNATLLHDDVVDLGDYRRGEKTSRLLYGNAASIFSGDWLLMEALRRVRGTGFSELMDTVFETIEEMILAESIQLENKGKLDTSRESYFKVVEGKTASLFRWAMYAGAKAGNLSDKESKLISEYGNHLGIAFQLIDDALDYEGLGEEIGKEPLADLREGKMTYPLILALEKRPETENKLRQIVEIPKTDPIPSSMTDELLRIIQQENLINECKALANRYAEQAVEVLNFFPAGKVSDALKTVANTIVERKV